MRASSEPSPCTVPLRDHAFDLESLLGAVTQRTKIVYIATPNNPTGTMTGRASSIALVREGAGSRAHGDRPGIRRVHRDPGYPDAIAELGRAGDDVLVLRTFSKIYGLAGLRVGYGVGRKRVVTAIGKVRRAFEVDDAGAGGSAREPGRPGAASSRAGER